MKYEFDFFWLIKNIFTTLTYYNYNNFINFNNMTLNEYSYLKQELNYIQTKISYNFGKLDSRWYDRKINETDITHNDDILNLQNIYKCYGELQNIVKKYIK